MNALIHTCKIWVPEANESSASMNLNSTVAHMTNNGIQAPSGSSGKSFCAENKENNVRENNFCT
jgi:hypothetical protein